MPNQDKLMMEIAMLLAQRSTCNRAQIGAVLASQNRIISTGYTGAPTGQPHCTDVGCEIDEKTGGCIRTVHAEANAIAYAGRYGISTLNTTLYTTMSPCVMCAKLIVAAGIVKLVYKEAYRDQKGIELCVDNGLEVVEIVTL